MEICTCGARLLSSGKCSNFDCASTRGTHSIEGRLYQVEQPAIKLCDSSDIQLIKLFSDINCTVGAVVKVRDSEHTLKFDEPLKLGTSMQDIYAATINELMKIDTIRTDVISILAKVGARQSVISGSKLVVKKKADKRVNSHISIAVCKDCGSELLKNGVCTNKICTNYEVTNFLFFDGTLGNTPSNYLAFPDDDSLRVTHLVCRDDKIRYIVINKDGIVSTISITGGISKKEAPQSIFRIVLDELAENGDCGAYVKAFRQRDFSVLDCFDVNRLLCKYIKQPGDYIR